MSIPTQAGRPTAVVYIAFHQGEAARHARLAMAARLDMARAPKSKGALKRWRHHADRAAHHAYNAREALLDLLTPAAPALDPRVLAATISED